MLKECITGVTWYRCEDCTGPAAQRGAQRQGRQNNSDREKSPTVLEEWHRRTMWLEERE